MNGRIDISGQRFGTLMVVGFSHSASRSTYWKCRCDCGRFTTTARSNLRNPNHRSCGCLKDIVGKKSRQWRGCGDIPASWFSHLTSQARRRSIPVSVSLEYLWDLFRSQGDLCALSGLPLQFPDRYRDRGDKCTASLDRVDSSVGYTAGNVQWLHKDVNFMKHQLSQDRFLELCGSIFKHSVAS